MNANKGKKLQKKRAAKKTGPKPDTLKIEGDWYSAIGKAIQKERPEEGWPEPEREKGKKSESE